MRRPKKIPDTGGKINLGRFSLSYDIPVIFSFAVALLTAGDYIFDKLAGPDIKIAEDSILVSFRENKAYGIQDMLVPIFHFTLINSGDGPTYLGNDGLSMSLGDNVVFFKYEHDSFLKRVPEETDSQYEEDDNGRSPVFAIEGKKIGQKTVAYVPAYDPNTVANKNGSGLPSLDMAHFSKFLSMTKNEKIFLKFYFSVYNPGLVSAFTGKTQIEIHCDIVVSEDMLNTAKTLRFADAYSPVCWET